MNRLLKLIPNLVELVFNNITFLGDRRTQHGDLTIQDILYCLIKAAGCAKSKLMKFKLSNINLHTQSQNLIKGICRTLENAQYLILLDLSWCKLAPKDLVLISVTMMEYCDSLRNLNLSYNQLNFDENNPKEPNIVLSEQFLVNLEEFLDAATFLNHVNFSGMNLGEK